MFTGIVKQVGTIKKIARYGQGRIFFIEVNLKGKISKGSSVCVDGVCLTMRDKKSKIMEFEVMPETLRKTALGKLKIGSRVNLETSLKIGDEIGGHFVYGHVDQIGKIVEIYSEGINKLVSIKIDNQWKRYLAPEGSVAISGVSLTVAKIKSNIFTVSLIEYTLKNTTLGKFKVGDLVNLEFDMLAKYLDKILKNNKYDKGH